MQPPSIHINCPKCGTSNGYFKSTSYHYACSSCYSIFHSSLKLNNEKGNGDYSEYCSILPIGTQLNYNGNTYTLTGKLVKYEQFDKTAIWAEYIFTAYNQPTLVLSSWNNHWNLLIEVPELMEEWHGKRKPRSIEYDGLTYEDFHRYHIRFWYAEGEFDYDIFSDVKSRVHEYICPPYNIFLEYNTHHRLTAHKGEYLYRSQLRKLLIDAVDLPTSVGIAGAQPFYFNFDPPLFIKGSFFTVILMALIVLLVKSFYPTITVANDIPSIEVNDSVKTYVYESFTIPYNYAILDIQMTCYDLQNDWVAADVSLINDGTGEELYFNMEAEFYSGYEGGEPWSEGSRTAKGDIPQLKRGVYHLEITPIQQHFSSPKSIVFNASIYKGNWGLFWLFTILLIILNIVAGITYDYFLHKKRGEEYDTFDFLLDSE